MSGKLFLGCLKENLKRRLWVFWLLLIGNIFLYFVAGLVMMYTAASEVGEKTVASARDLYELREIYYFLFGPASFQQFLFLGVGAFMALQGYSYLMNQRKVDFYHATPVSRSLRFNVVALASLLMHLASHLPILLFSLPLSTSFAPRNLPEPLVTQGLIYAVLIGEAGNLLAFLAGFATACLAMMLTGHILVALVGGLVLALYEPFSLTIFRACMSTFYRHFYEYGPSNWERSDLAQLPLSAAW